MGERGSLAHKLNSIYSLQQAAGYNSLSINQVGAGGLTLNAGVRGGTLIVTREDFNIEDIHCQMVSKIQRNNQLLKEIEGIPADNQLMMSAEDHIISN